MALKLFTLLVVSAVVAFCSTAVIDPTSYVANTIQGDKIGADVLDIGIINEDDDNKIDDISKAQIDGISLKDLTDKEINELLDEDDNITALDLDIIVARKLVKLREKSINDVTNAGRQKRWIGLAARGLFTAGRALFKGATRAPKPTVSGTRVTQQYTRHGNYNDATRIFNGFKPDNVKSFNNGRISGQTGTVGPHRFTVRDGSKQGSPTLEVRSPRPNGEYVRKFRFE